MIQSRRLEFNIQLGVFIAGILIFIGCCVTEDVGLGFVCFYFGVGVSQLISLISKFLSMEKFGVFLKIYAWIIIPVWGILISLIILAGLDLEKTAFSQSLKNTVGYVVVGYLIFAVFASPVLAIGFLVHLHDAMWRNESRL